MSMWMYTACMLIATPLSSRPGFTLVEALVSMLLLVMTLIALEGTAAAVMRQLADGARESVASQLARRRSESWRSVPCATASGIDSTDGVSLHWSTTVDSTAMTIDMTTVFRTRSSVRTESYRTTRLCS